ncbi:MAG TPA: CBS domain-containing protein [Gemmatimonadales bacterium]|nr:CBS domain-containing protein [Gemmatimonadales bacterium]
MLKVRDIMTTEVLTLTPDVPLRDAMALLSRHHVSGAPVLAGERVVGVLSATDLMDFESEASGVPEERPEMELEEWEAPVEWVEGEEAPAAFFSDFWSDAGADVLERFAEVRGPEWDALADRTVGEAMSRALCTVTPGTDVYEAAGYMDRAGVHRLLVQQGRRLVGILTSRDLVRAVAQHRLIAADPGQQGRPVAAPAGARR